MIERPKCETCAFWEMSELSDCLGVCRRRAPGPVVMEDELGIAAYWPITADSDWCGEHHRFAWFVETLERSRRV